jgi:hypothetical protein
MLTMRFGPGALERVRFAISPLIETTRSIRVLDDPAGQALHLPWVAETRERVRDLDLDPIRALLPADRYTPDFIHPPPESPLAELDDELEHVLATPPDQVRAEVRRAHRGRPVPAVLRPLMDEPATGVPALVALLRAYWERAIAPHWPRLRALLEGDVLHRARQMADSGARRLFADIDPTISWADGVLRIDKRFDFEMDLEERGLLFVPAAFVWPLVLTVTDRRWQPTIIYPARGVGWLWASGTATPPEALAALLGRNRAAVLMALDQPRSTTDLARAVGITAGGVSQHLAVLRAAGLVHGHRVGRVVLNLRSPAGDNLVGAT